MFERGDAVFVFNWHPYKSYSDYRVGCLKSGKYKIVLNSDSPVFGGYGNVKDDVEFIAQGGHDGRPHSFQVRARTPGPQLCARARSSLSAAPRTARSSRAPAGGRHQVYAPARTCVVYAPAHYVDIVAPIQQAESAAAAAPAETVPAASE